ncbi:MAG: transposase, partial [Planctomycetota bacterium]|nr:transposase [Planctomycetota bacterium]
QKAFEFHGLGRRGVIAGFSGGEISSDGGGLLLREVERATGVLRRSAGCFTDHRDPELVEHSVLELVSQRV